MSRVLVNIDRLVLRGFESLEGKAVAEELRSQLSELLSDRGVRGEWARSHRTPLLKLGRMPLESGTADARKLGAGVARAIGKGLKP